MSDDGYRDYYSDYSDGFDSSRRREDDALGASDYSDSETSEGLQPKRPAHMCLGKDVAVLAEASATQAVSSDSKFNAVPSDAKFCLENVLDESVDPWSAIAQIDDVEACFTEYWHLLIQCSLSLRAGSVDFVSTNIVSFTRLVESGVEFCPEHHLVSMGNVIETIDLLCNCLPRIKATRIRRNLTTMQHSLDVVKAETVDFLRQQVHAQHARIVELQKALSDHQALVSALQTQLESNSTAVSFLSFSSSLSEHSSLQNSIFTVRDRVITKEQRWDGEGNGHGTLKQESGRLCAGKCGKMVVKSGFTKSQWRKAQDGSGKCMSCSVVAKELDSALGPRV